MATDGTGRRCRSAWLAALCLHLSGCLCGFAQSPIETLQEPWQVVSLLEDAGLSKKNLFNISFDRDPASARFGTAWLATSHGLYEYDGYTWRRYGQTNGLPSDFVRCVRLTRKGDLWVGTDRGAGTFDGRTFLTHGSETGLAGPNVRRIDEDAEGILWFSSDSWPNGDASGGITSWRDGQWHAYRKEDGLPSPYVVNHFRDSQGRHFAATLDGLAELRGERWVRAFTPPKQVAYKWRSSSLAESVTDGLMYSAGHEVFLCRENGWEQLPSDRPHHSAICSTSDGHLIASGLVNGLHHAFFEWEGGDWKIRSSTYTVPMGYHEDLQEAPDGSLWVLGYDCLVRWQRRGADWREFRPLPPPQFTDGQGGVWFARMLINPLTNTPVRLFNETWASFPKLYDQLFPAKDGTVWGWASNRISHWQESKETETPAHALQLRRITAGTVDHQGVPWFVGKTLSGTNGVSYFDGHGWVMLPLPELPGKIIASGISGAATGIWAIAEGPNEEEPLRLARITGGSVETQSIPRRLISRFRFEMQGDRAGGLWLYGDAGLVHLRPGARDRFEAVTNLPARHVFACCERGNELWFGYSGTTGGASGLARWRNEAWTLYPTETLSTLRAAEDGTLTAAGQGMITVIPNEPEPTPFIIETPNQMLASGVIKDHAGNYWVGDNSRVLRFMPDRVPPRTGVSLGQDKLLVGDPLRVTAWATERFRPRGSRKDHRFSWKLDSEPWSRPSATNSWEIATKGLASGPHQLAVKAQDAGLDWDPRPAQLSIQIFPIPIQSRKWFLPALVGLLLLVASLGTAAWRAKAQLANHARGLESVVRERTAELQADLEERKRMAEALRVTEEKFSRAFRSSPIALAIWRLSDGCFTEVNDAFESLTGYQAGELLGQTAKQLNLYPDPLESPASSNAKPAPRAFRDQELPLRTKSGEVRTVLKSIEFITIAGETCALTTWLDLTDRRCLEEQLRQAQKLEAVGTLAGGIAHDFNNILSAVVGYVDLTRLEIGANHPASENLEHIRKAGTRAKNLIQQLLSFSRPQPQSRQITLLQAVVEESVNLLRATLPKTIDLTTTIHDNAPPILADVNQIHQALLNLCTNARHALDSDQGRIEIALRGVQLDEDQVSKLQGLRPGMFTCLSVSDSGEGMDPAVIPRIFEPFFTTKSPGQGSGLGLSVVHGIVKSHDGAILVNSKPGSGTTFQMFFPKALGPLEHPPLPRASTPRGSGQHILYLDDEEVLVDLATRILGRLGYRVTGFTDANQAMEAFRLEPHKFDVVVTDLNMPGISGMQVADRILREHPHAPVILSSGFITEQIQTEARRIGILQVLYKPNTMEDLGAAVHRLISELKHH